MLPVAVGSRWTFDIETVRRSTYNGVSNRYTGPVTVEVVSADACANDTQVFHVRERITETVEYHPYNSDVWIYQSGPTVREQTYRWTVSDTDVTTTAPRYPDSGTGSSGSPPPPFANPAPRYVAPAALQNGTFALDPPGPTLVTLRAGVGPESYSLLAAGTWGTYTTLWTATPAAASLARRRN